MPNTVSDAMRLRYIVLALAFVVLAYFGPLLKGQEPAQPSSPVTNVPGTVSAPAPGAPSQPAVAVTTVPSPASPQNPTDQIGWALAMSLALRYITKKGWLSFLTPDADARVKAFCSFVVAACTAAGIHLVVNGSFLSADGATLSISGLTLDAIKDIGFQWVAQQAWYEGLVKGVKA